MGCCWCRYHKDPGTINLKDFDHEKKKQQVVYRECPICLENLDSNIVALPCAHIYHDTCVQRWSQKRRSCPICQEKFELI